MKTSRKIMMKIVIKDILVKIGRKNSEQKQVISNLEKLYKSREEVLNLFRDFTNMVFEVKYKAKRAAGLKINT